MFGLLWSYIIGMCYSICVSGVLEHFSMLADVFEWTSCFLGLTGAFLLACNTRFSKFGWVAFLLANFAACGFAVLIDRKGLLLQQFGFIATSLLGLYRSGLFSFKSSAQAQNQP